MRAKGREGERGDLREERGRGQREGGKMGEMRERREGGETESR